MRRVATSLLTLILVFGLSLSLAPAHASAGDGASKATMNRESILAGDLALAGPEVSPSPAPANTWFFAEGSTAAPFQTWLLLFNPSPTVNASATLTFMFPAGEPVSRTVVLDANRRVSFFVNQVLPNVPAFSTRVDATAGILAERAMYFNQDGTDSFGAPVPQTTWLFAEGSTAPPFDTWFLVQNPGSVPANVTFTFFREGGGVAGTTTATVGPTSRFSLFADPVIPNLSFSTQVTSTQPVVVELSMFETSSGGGHNVIGVQTGNDAWNFAEGATVAPFHTWFLLFNPNNFTVRILARLMPERAGPGPLLDFNIPPLSRTSFFANTAFPNRSFASAWIAQTAAGDPAPVVIDRTMFFFKPGSGSHATVGAPARSITWQFAEGATAPPFDEWLLLSNPSLAGVGTATITFISNGQIVTTRTLTVTERVSLFVNQLVPNAPNLSIIVNCDVPIVVERSMYFRQGGTNTIGSPG